MRRTVARQAPGSGLLARRPAEPEWDDATLAGRAAWWAAWNAERRRLLASMPAFLSHSGQERWIARRCRVPLPPCYTCGAPPDDVYPDGSPWFEHGHDPIVQAAVRIFGDDLIVPRPRS